jgi:predicted HicB family RNase H-like nuclease
LRGKETIEAEYTRVMKEMEANFEKQLDVRVEQRVSEITASRRLAQQPVLTSSSP